MQNYCIFRRISIILAAPGQRLKAAGVVQANRRMVGGPDLEKDSLGLKRAGLRQQSRQKPAGDALATEFGQHRDVFQLPLWAAVLRDEKSYDMHFGFSGFSSFEFGSPGFGNPGEARGILRMEDIQPLLPGTMSGFTRGLAQGRDLRKVGLHGKTDLDAGLGHCGVRLGLEKSSASERRR